MRDRSKADPRFGQVLKEHRQRYDLSQVECAHRLGVSARVVGMWEAGDRSPDVMTLYRRWEDSDAVTRRLIAGLVQLHMPKLKELAAA